MNRRQLRRIEKIEQRLVLVANKRQLALCNCRPRDSGIETLAHTTEELKAIAAVPCPVHGRREIYPGFYTPEDMPLLPEDRQFCTCPPNAWRELNEREQDKDPTLTSNERERLRTEGQLQWERKAESYLRQLEDEWVADGTSKEWVQQCRKERAARLALDLESGSAVTSKLRSSTVSHGNS